MFRSIQRFASTGKNTSNLLRAQININNIINCSEDYKKSIERRQLPGELLSNIDFIIENHPLRFQLFQQINQLKREREDVSQSLKNGGDLDTSKQRLKEIKSELKPLEKQVKDLEEDIYIKAESLPNLIDPTVPVDPFTEDIVQFINCESESDVHVSEKQDHKDIGVRFNIMDFNAASKVSGSSWYYLIGDGALLEQALVQYAFTKARKYGYTMVIPPSIVKSEIVNACGFKPNDQNNEKQIYQLEGEGKSLTGTAEIPLAALHASSIFRKGTTFPKKYVGVSRSYRAEAGASGKDTKGLYRVHEFTKVELFHFTTDDKASEELEQLKDMQVEIITELGLKAKVMNMPTSDLGSPAMKKYDIEAWMPGRGSWGELTSCSNCGDYQSRRLGIRYSKNDDERLSHVTTINGTAMAVPRVIVALIEQNYNPETDEIAIPKVLQPYMGGQEKIVPNVF
ncbi:DIA4 Serine--tRNA ligase [Candida maltosa Xu316]|uniref:serine--tRNA ligase n=1 Tax=Candida maltosa (strain Xu316) TaxID=1245528 RepID=M3JSJ5_CANMX|nr:Putative seryl-tRNA synthetase, putative [Candida maltosa Xu316]